MAKRLGAVGGAAFTLGLAVAACGDDPQTCPEVADVLNRGITHVMGATTSTVGSVIWIEGETGLRRTSLFNFLRLDDDLEAEGWDQSKTLVGEENAASQAARTSTATDHYHDGQALLIGTLNGAHDQAALVLGAHHEDGEFFQVGESNGQKDWTFRAVQTMDGKARVTSQTGEEIAEPIECPDTGAAREAVDQVLGRKGTYFSE